jgi:hypothetical protein
MDSTLQSLGLPRKTIGINVTQIGFDEVSIFFQFIFCFWGILDRALSGGGRVSSKSGRPSPVRFFF